ncbi:MAG: DegT/DnrJ/EryC1/StrS family aminotransferase [Syntrophobacteraceae bacterium]
MTTDLRSYVPGPSLEAAGTDIPFLDLVGPHLELEEELVSVFRRSLKSADFIGGKMVEGFESEFAAFCQTLYCTGVGSGTDGLRLALMAAGISAGDIVVTVPNTFIATTEAISQTGAIADFVDVDEAMLTMDAQKLGEYLETRCSFDNSGRLIHREMGRPVTAVIPVHLYGQPADMDPILNLAKEYGLQVIEDACQAHGAQYFSIRENGWKRAGSFGVAAAFSFYPGKNLGACGEAGAVTTNDRAVAARIGMLGNHGQSRKYYHDMEGYNSRLDAIQAGILRVKLKHLPEWNQKRQECAALYGELLSKAPGVRLPYAGPRFRPVWHLYVIRTERRDALKEHLERHCVSTGLHYPLPLHLQKSYRRMHFSPGAFPVAETAAARILSLPMGPTLTKDQIEYISDIIFRFMST